MAETKKRGNASRRKADTVSGQLPREQLYSEVEERFGVLPNFFRLPPENPEITTSLFGFAKFSYLDSPLPSLFKERLFVYLSRFCDVRYCIVRQVGFLMGLGNPAGDAKSPVNSAEEVIRLLTRPLPHAESLDTFVARLQALAEPLSEMPDADSELEEAVFACATHAFLQTQSAPKCLDALRGALGESPFQYLLVFLAFVRTAHYWTKVQTELRLEDDVAQMLASHDMLAEALLKDPAAITSEVGQALMDELEFLRGEHRRNGELLREHKALTENKDRLLYSKSAELAERVAEFERLNAEIRDSRRAALNVMEDTILSREALRESEKRLRRLNEELEERVRERTLDLAEANVSLESEARERRAAEGRVKGLLKQLITAQEQERRHVARELHDTLGQQLEALRLALAMLKSKAGHQAELCKEAERMQEIFDLLDSNVDFLAWELRPVELDDVGLDSATRNFVRQWSEHFRIAADYQSFGLEDAHLPPEVETNIYRILQEALQNVHKHAEADHVSVALQRHARQVALIVEDDGRGYDADEEVSAGGNKRMGVTNMRERAALIGGSVEIESAPGEGTTIIARVPLAGPDEEGIDERE